MKRLLIGLLAVVALTACGGGRDGAAFVYSLDADRGRRSHRASRPLPLPCAPADPTAPTRLRLDGIDAPVVPLALSGSALVPPADPTVLGWWGRNAGAAHGVTLLVGHTVHTGGGDLDNLEDVPVGATANVSGLRYQVARVQVISKAALAEQAPRLFAQSGPHRLVIVTCEDYNPATGHYDSNVVLTATRSMKAIACACTMRGRSSTPCSEGSRPSVAASST